MRELILGGVKSGKSALGMRRAIAGGKEVVFIATATAGDEEMRRRIERHKRERPDHWRLVEEPIHLSRTIKDHAANDRCVLVDCLTLWLTNLLVNEDTNALERETQALLQVLDDAPGHVILISNETGLGIMPANALARRFGDEAGMLNQRIAAVCDRVTLVSAGLPLILKDREEVRGAGP
jgi:adenosylcobinamide kinase / adenosylcobinamide-phosphate guanylyltransferase